MNTVESSIAFNSSIIPAGIDSPHLPLSSRMKGWRLAGFIASAAVLAWAAAPDSHAATIDWKSAPTNTTWATGSNWDGGIAPANSLTTDIARFNQTSYTSQPNAGTTSIAGIEIGNGTTATGALTLSGTNLSIGASGITKFANSGTAAISSNVTLGAAQSWTNNSSTLLTVSGNVTNAGYVLTIGGSGNTTISTGAVSGTGGIIKSGDGTLSMTGTNTGWSGGITIKSGTVSQGTNAASLGTGTITLGDSSGSSNATLMTATALTVTTPITVAAGSSGTLMITTASGITSSYSGAVALNNQLTLGNLGSSGAQTLTIGAGGITGSSDIIVDSAGNPVVIAGTNNATWTGNLIVKAGTAQLGGNAAVPGVVSIGSGATFDFVNNTAAAVRGIQDYSGAGGTVTSSGGGSRILTVNGNGTYAFSGNITSGPSANGFTVALGSSGVQILSGSNTYNGTTTVTSGILNIRSGSALGSTVGSTTVAANATLQLEGGITVGNETLTINGLGAAGQNGALVNVSGTNSYGGQLTMGSEVTTAISSDSSGTLNLTNTGTITNTNSRTLMLTGSGNGSLAGVLANGAITKNGTGTWTLTSTSTYNGTTTVTSGILNIRSGSALGSTVGSTTVAVNATLQLEGGITVGNETLTINGLGAAGQNGALVNVSGNNSYGGQLTMGSNTGGTAISSDSSGTLNLTNTGIITNANNRTLMLTGSGNGSLAGVLAASAAITKNGTGTWTLTSNNTYSGSTTISAGTLQIGNGGTTGAISSASAISNNGTMVFNRTNDVVQGTDFSAAAITGTGNLTQSGTGNLTLNAANSYTGVTKVSAGNLILSNSLALQNSTLDTLNSIAGTATAGFKTTVTTLTLGGLTGDKSLSTVFTTTSGGYSGNLTALTINPGIAVTNSYSGDISDGAAGMTLTKTGTGTQILSGNNTYTGTTTISAGTLQIGNGGTTGSLSTSSAITNNGALAFNRSNAVVQGTDFSAAAITGTGMVIQNGSGTMTLSNSTNSFSGGVWVQQGSLYADSIGNSGSASYLGSGTTIKLGNGTTGGTLRITGTGTQTTNKVIDLSGTTGGGTITNLSSNITFTSNLTMSGSGAKTLNLASSGSNTSTTNFNGLLSDANGTLSVRMNGSGNANFSLGNANNSFSGAMILDGNTNGKTYTLSVAGLGNATANSYLGRNATINIGSTDGTNILKYTGSGETTDKVINLNGTIGSVGLDQSGTGLLKFTSNFTATGVGAKTLTLQGSTAGTGEVAGIIVDSSGGATSVQKAGSGTWTLSGNNTFTGQSLLNAGVTIVSTIGNFGESSNLGQGTSGASVRMGSTTTTGTLAYTGSGNTSNRTFQVGSGNGTGSATLTNNGSGALVFTASAFNSADTSSVSGFSNRTLTLRGSNTGNNEIQGAIINNTNGMVSVTKNDAGTWMLSGNNTYTGATTISAGTLVLNGTNSGSAITINSGGTLAGSGTGGATTVNSGGKIGPGNSPGILTVGDLTLNSGGTYTWEMANATGAAGTGWDQLNATGLLTIGSTANSTFTIAITSTGAPANWNYATTNQSWDIFDYGTISGFNASYFTLNSTAFGGDLTPDSSWSLTDTGSALRLTYNYTQNTPTYAGATGVWSTGFTPAITNSANAIFLGTGGTATNDIASATLSSIGSLTFDGTNSYTLEANSGSAGYSSASALAIGGTIVNNSSAVQTINLATSFAANQTINANTGGIVIGGNIAVGSGATLTVVGSNNTALSGVVSGLGGLTKNSSSTLTLSGNNTYSGNTTIGQGKVLIGDNNAFGTGSVKLGISGVNATITLASTDSTARTISNTLDTFAGNSSVTTFGESSGGTGNLSFTNSTGVSLGSTSRTFNVLNTTSLASGFSTVSGAIVKTGSGTLILTGGSTYNGSTTINAGTLQLGNGGTTGSLSAGSAITNNGTLVFNRSNSMTQGTAFASAIGGTGNVIQAGTGTLVLSGANTYTGSTTVSTGNLTISSASALGGTGSGTTVANGAALQIQGDIAVGAEALNIAGSGFSNAGALRNLSGANSLSGAITLSAATTIGSDAGTLTLSGGISGTQNLTLTGAGNTTISGAIATSTGTLTKNGSGTTTLNAANTYTGTTTVNSGTLTAAAANALGNSTVINVNGGSFLVTAENAVNDNAAINLGGGRMAVSGTFNETVGALTLSANSTIDFAGFVGTLRFSGVGSWASGANLAIWNWSGTTQYGTQVNNYATPSNLVFSNNSTLTSNLANISFYSDSGNSFVGSGFEVTGFSGGGSQIIAVPETETYFYAVALLAGLVVQYIRRRARRKSWEAHPRQAAVNTRGL